MDKKRGRSRERKRWGYMYIPKNVWSTCSRCHLWIALTNAVITIAIRLRYDYDPITIRLHVSRAPASNSTQAKNEHANFSL